MIVLHRLKPVFAAVLMLGVVLALAACTSVNSMAVSKAKAAGDFGMIVQAYKSGQFLLNGAILSPMDLSSHFAYLRDQHKLPKNVLLERSDKQKIHKEHLRYMASMAWSYHFKVYFSNDGKLRQIVPTASDKMELENVRAPTTDGAHPHIDSYDATHGPV